MADPVKRRLLCLCCGAESECDETQDACPACGDSKHVPADLDDMLTIQITKHELRILTIWASNWARDECSKKAVGTITDRLALQTDAALTMSQEIADLRAHFGEGNVVVILRGDGSKEIQEP